MANRDLIEGNQRIAEQHRALFSGTVESMEMLGIIDVRR
jgi:hypothetical protein